MMMEMVYKEDEMEVQGGWRMEDREGMQGGTRIRIVMMKRRVKQWRTAMTAEVVDNDEGMIKGNRSICGSKLISGG